MSAHLDIKAVRFGRITGITSADQVLVETEDDSKGLPLPFPIGRHFGSDRALAEATLINSRVTFFSRHPEVSALPVVVLEPDYAVDVTEASSFVTAGGSDDSTIATKRLRQTGQVSAPLVKGNIINAALDVLVRRPASTDEELLQEAVQTRPLAVAALALNRAEYEGLLTSVRDLLTPLRRMVDSWQGAQVVLEPFLISPILGLQGRADIVIRRGGDIEVIELKAGKAPHEVRHDHQAQAASYVALLMAAGTPMQSIAARLWYITDEQRPLRDVTDVYASLGWLIDARNAVVLNELRIRRSDMTMLRRVIAGPSGMPGISSYEYQDVKLLSERLQGLRNEEKNIIAEWIRMATNESLTSRLGGGSGWCAADLWRQTEAERRSSPNVICEMKLDLERSNLEAMHLTFHRSPQTVATAIRKGDSIVLREMSDMTSGDRQAAGLEVYKGSVRSIDATHVSVSLRNKYANVLDQDGQTWMIEHDVIDQNVRSVSTSIRSLIDADQRRRDVLLGLAAPCHDTPSASVAENLTDVQRSVVERAVAARELFLIQGPPGSGKTSAVLRAIVQELLRLDGHRVLALAYTNRAANEICDVLERNGVSFLRHGSLEGATGEGSIPRLARELDPVRLADEISRARVIVATVASLNSSSEIFAFRSFDTVIVDEASQIVEPQLIGTLARCKRTIMIGDHCQLPAVIGQPAELLKIDRSIPESLCMTNLGMSGFERLLRCAERRHDTATVAMLTQQGRMHQDVMHFPSEAFYGGRLTCLRESQRSTEPLPWADVISERICMIDVETPQQLEAEARTVCGIAAGILSHASGDATPPSIGIITPFRIQNTLVGHILDEQIPSHLRDQVSVDTVERFQGSERDVIIYGTSVSTEQELESIRSDVLVADVPVDRKLNVAITRAREQFILVGNPTVLAHSPIYRRLMESIPHRQAAS
ncbi:MAG: DEAD/DEAH box helicase [Candidatus Kapabacteria bacterium]|nr:DEAD/DEAH box helicase [Candidatus Kapabacteria bacterium]